MNRLNWPWLFAILNIVIHLAFYNNLEFHRDELLYFSLGLHPSWGYASVPPLISWLATFIQSTIGFTLFAVKFFPALLSGIFVLLCSAITKELGGKGFAQALTSLVIVCAPFTLRTFHLFQPVHLDLFFWTLVFYLTIRYINARQDRDLTLLGIVFGLALLNKYLIALLIPALFISIFFSEWRMIFNKKSFYGAIGIGLLIWLPNLIWQYSNDFPAINHINKLSEVQLVHVNRLDFLKDLLLMPWMGTLLTIPGLFYLCMHKKYRPVGIAVLLVISALILLQGKSYYAMGVFPILIAAGAKVAEMYCLSKVIRVILVILILGVSIPILPLGIPIYKQDGLVKYFESVQEKLGLTLGRTFEDGTIHSLPQDYADQLGWTELTKLTLLAYEKIPDTSKALIYAENYGQAGAISIIGRKYGLPEAVSFSDSYRYWTPLRFDPDIEYFIYINDELGEDVKSSFRDIEQIGHISNVHAREYGTAVYLCTSPVRSFNVLWSEVLKRVAQE